MSIYRNTCPDCEDSYETDAWEPSQCPFCEVESLRKKVRLLLEALEWMVANDETNESDEGNIYYIDGLNQARAAIANAK